MIEESAGKLQLYLKLIEYKRSLGTTQWSVFSLFATVSQAILVFSLQQQSIKLGIALRILCLGTFWLGFLLYNRYRMINETVAEYLRNLEGDLQVDFETRLDKKRSETSPSTRAILIGSGLLYTVFVIVASIIM
ncbi:hypothetical protein [Geobacter sp.]|uniref:hypothetical protein n=1 Tax=Geobacter sp. TaxID=46610 RepID=UPI0027B957B5|nr:hypothetical protein [Geobacter sp.]